MGYIDMHCDTLTVALRKHKSTITNLDNSMIDISRLKKSNCDAQFFAMFLSQQAKDGIYYGYEKDKLPSLEEILDDMYKVFLNTLEENIECLAFALNFNDLKRNREEGKVSAFLTIENGYPVKGKMENLKKFYDMGVRLISLTWNDPNCFGQNNTFDPKLKDLGLTDFGKEAISYMNDLGIIIDVSHLNDGGIKDVYELSKKPFVASHSNARVLSPHQRNLTDEQIRWLGESGSVSGLNFCANFLNQDISNNVSSIDRMCDHILHFINVGGEDSIGIGTDFDGIGSDLEIKDCTEMYKLYDALRKRGLSERMLDKVWSKNVERVIKESMK